MARAEKNKSTDLVAPDMKSYEEYYADNKPAPGAKQVSRPLSRKEYEFCKHFVMCRSIPEACRRAGYSEKISYNQFKKPNIQAQIKYLEKQMAIHYVAEQYQVINELSAIAFTGIDDVAEWDAENNQFSLKEMADISPLAMKAIKSVKNVTHKDGRRTLEVELQDKIPVLNMLMKYMGMLQDDEKRLVTINNLNVNDVDSRIRELLAKREDAKAISPANTDDYEVIEVDEDGNPIENDEVLDEREY